MGKSIYLSHHSGEDLDKAISLIASHGLENLEHDKGVFTEPSQLPPAKNGDFAYVGTNFSAMYFYVFNKSWNNTGTVVNLNSRDIFTAMPVPDNTDYKDVF